MERAKQQQQQPSQSSGQSSAAPAPASKPLPINGTAAAATKDSTTTNKDIKSSHKNIHDSSTYNEPFCLLIHSNNSTNVKINFILRREYLIYLTGFRLIFDSV